MFSLVEVHYIQLTYTLQINVVSSDYASAHKSLGIVHVVFFSVFYSIIAFFKFQQHFLQL